MLVKAKHDYLLTNRDTTRPTKFKNLLKTYFKSYSSHDREEVIKFLLMRFSNCLIPSTFNTKHLCFY